MSTTQGYLLTTCLHANLVSSLSTLSNRRMRSSSVDLYQSHQQSHVPHTMSSTSLGKSPPEPAEQEGVVQPLNEVFYTTTYNREISRPASEMGCCLPASEMGYCLPASEMGCCLPASEMGFCLPASEMGFCLPASEMGFC